MFFAANFEISSMRDDGSLSGVLDMNSVGNTTEASSAWSAEVNRFKCLPEGVFELKSLSEALFLRVGHSAPIPYQPKSKCIGVMDIFSDAGYFIVACDDYELERRSKFMRDSLLCGFHKFTVTADVDEQRKIFENLPAPEPRFLFHSVKLTARAVS